MSNKIELGSEVTWSSSTNGTTKQKRGVVVAVVPANKWRVYLKDLITDSLQNYAINGLDCMLYRKQESYIIAVPATGRGKAKLYWPRTSALRKVQPDAEPVRPKE